MAGDMRARFDQFTGSLSASSQKDKEQLFQDFLKWQAQRR